MDTIRKKISKEVEASKKTWGLSYEDFSKVIRDHDLKVGVEIGVAYGGHSEAILKNTEVKKLYGVDPYKHTEGYIDSMNYPQEEFDELYKMTLERLSVFGKRYEHIRHYSKEAVDKIDGSVDFVYIDADHSYSGVWNDLCLWFSKVRDGGIIGGHDYMHPDFPGVQKAIDEFFGRLNWPVTHEGHGVWWVEKKHEGISFFIPAFNCENTINESLHSIIDTNFSDGDEIVIVNDYSTDNTAKILAEFSEKYPFIKVINHTRNKGGATARNTAIENTKHQILFCLDSDNILAPNSIKPLQNFMLETGAHVAAFQNIYFFKDNISVIHKKVHMVSDLVTLEDCFSNKITPPSSGNYMFTKISWLKAGGYPDGNWLDTWGFGVRQLFTGSKMVTLPNTHYFHRRGHESYYIRGSKSSNVSLTALSILIPYLDRLSKSSINYIMGTGRYTWFDHMDEKHLKLAPIPKHLVDTKTAVKEFLKNKFPKMYKVYLKNIIKK